MALPVVLVLVFSLIGVAEVTAVTHIVQATATEGARIAAFDGANAACQPNNPGAVEQAVSANMAANHLNGFSLNQDLTITTDNVTVNGTSQCLIHVQVMYPYHVPAPFIAAFMGHPDGTVPILGEATFDAQP